MTDTERSLLGTVSETAGRVLLTLPAQFLVLVLMNTVFILGLLWFLDHQSAARERVLTPFLMACLHERS